MLVSILAAGYATVQCINPTGYDAERDRVICGPKPAKLSASDIAAFKRDHEGIVRSAAQAEYAHFCGFRSIKWQMQVEGRAEYAIMHDRRFSSMTVSQRQSLQRWRSDVRDVTLNFLGRDGRSCGFLASAPFFRKLDQLASPY